MFVGISFILVTAISVVYAQIQPSETETEDPFPALDSPDGQCPCECSSVGTSLPPESQEEAQDSPLAPAKPPDPEEADRRCTARAHGAYDPAEKPFMHCVEYGHCMVELLRPGDYAPQQPGKTCRNAIGLAIAYFQGCMDNLKEECIPMPEAPEPIRPINPPLPHPRPIA